LHKRTLIATILPLSAATVGVAVAAGDFDLLSGHRHER
jgi:hypothetical protein